MDAVTYPNDKLAGYVNEAVVPLRIDSHEQPYAHDFKVKWTPLLFILDPKGTSHHCGMGFFPFQELLPFIELGQAKFLFHTNELEEAALKLDRLLEASPWSGSAPEAVYLRGVSRFKATEDASHLREVHRILKYDYGNTMWAERGLPYWNL